jgi:hypothetical protein
MRCTDRFPLPKFSLQSFLLFAILFTLCASVANAAPPDDSFSGVGLTVGSPTIPAGGVLQMQVFITEPKPILKGKQAVRSGASSAAVANIVPAVGSPLGAIRDAALFSTGGDVSGVAVMGASGAQFFFSSPLETFGENVDTPVITLAYAVRKTATEGQSVPLTLDATNCLWLDPKGNQYPVELKSGTMTVGGTLAISDIVPGAGVYPPGTVISIKAWDSTPIQKSTSARQK